MYKSLLILLIFSFYIIHIISTDSFCYDLIRFDDTSDKLYVRYTFNFHYKNGSIQNINYCLDEYYETPKLFTRISATVYNESISYYINREINHIKNSVEIIQQFKDSKNVNKDWRSLIRNYYIPDPPIIISISNKDEYEGYIENLLNN